jgi:hypothetical protein
MEETDTLRDYLCHRAQNIFDFLVEKHRVPEGSSVYIITGTIRSTSWATATHDRPMNSPYDSLVLKRVLNDETLEQFFVWTERGSAQTRTQDGNRKDQTLFLRGFLMTASPTIWEARRRASTAVRQTPPSDMQGSSNYTTKERPGGEVPDRRTGELPASPSSKPSNSHSCSSMNNSGVSIHSFPASAAPVGDYPSYRINQALLDFVSTSFGNWQGITKPANAGGPDKCKLCCNPRQRLEGSCCGSW